METLIIMYVAKIALGLMLIPLYREYRKKQTRKLKVRQWRERILRKRSFAQATLF
ncbi:MAG: hypothetical protein WCT46_03540 [Candidatus Gracilibacteria bacterium]|jgi:hypothetical protein